MIIINGQKLDMKKLNKYILGSSVNLSEYFAKTKPFVNLTITSPPYWDMKKYGDVDEQIGYGQSYEEYLNDITKTFQGVYNISKNNSSLYVIVDTLKRDGQLVRLPDEIANRLESIGWIHQDTIIWDKVKTLPWSRKGQMRNIFEYILFFTKGNDYIYNINSTKNVDELKEWWVNYPERYSPEGKVPENIWKFSIPTQGSWGTKKNYSEEELFRHACPFPPEMMDRILRLSSVENDVILDPYAGTGVLLATALKLKRRYLGFDANIAYKNVFEKVTLPLVDEQWVAIEQQTQYREKQIEQMKVAIYKLRMLKFLKALVKKMRPIKDPNNPIPIVFTKHFSMNFVFERSLGEEEKNKIGKVKYFMVINENIADINIIKEQVKTLVSNSPFSKYGLIFQLEIVSSSYMIRLLNKLKLLELYLYTVGDTTKLNRILNPTNVIEILNSNQNDVLFDKDIPPLVSNIKLEEQDYSMIPAIKYEKKKYNELFARDESIIDLPDFDN